MQVAITGSSGLIGEALVASLASDGHTPIRVTRSGSDGIHWDIAKGEIDTASLEGIDAVVHLAGEGIAEKRWTAAQKREIHDSRVKGTTLLSESLARLAQPPVTLVSGSAIGYYGDRGDTRLTEESEPGEGFLTEVCLDWEAATAAAEEAGITVSHIRTGIVLARHGGVLKRLLLLYKFALGGRLGSGEQYMSWISIDDEVGAIRWLLDNPRSGGFNLTAPHPVTNSDFNKALAQAVHRPAIIPVPEFAPKILLGSELADSLLFTSANVVPERLEGEGFTFAHPTLTEALAHIVG